MITQPAQRTQIDGLQDEYSFASGTDFTGTEEITRQEKADETDINRIVARFMVDGSMPQLRQPLYGEQDFDIDLSSAYTAVAKARAAWNNSKELRQLYPDYQTFLTALYTGQYERDIEDSTLKEELRHTERESSPSGTERSSSEHVRADTSPTTTEPAPTRKT